MIINKDFYKCPECDNYENFDTSEPYKSICPKCGTKMNFLFNEDCDTDRPKPRTLTAEETHTLMYNIDHNLPTVQCPYCHSNATKKISASGRLFSVGLFGFGSSKVGKQYHCVTCGADF